MNPSTTLNLPTAAPLKQDASVIGLVGMAHLISHFSQLLLAPLFPWLKQDFTSTVSTRGGALIKKWGRSSAASTAVSIADAIKVGPTRQVSNILCLHGVTCGCMWVLFERVNESLC